MPRLQCPDQRGDTGDNRDHCEREGDRDQYRVHLEERRGLALSILRPRITRDPLVELGPDDHVEGSIDEKQNRKRNHLTSVGVREVMYQKPLAVLLVSVSTMGTMTDASPEGAVSDGSPRWERAADLFADWRGGDARAIDDLVRLMTPVLWHVVRAYRLERALAEDVVQSTWLALVRSAESIADSRAIFSWLTITARREAWRVGKNHGRADATSDEHLEQLLPPQESTETLVAASDESSRLWAAVQTLTERCQRLLRVIAFDERPDYAKIATDLEMPIGSIGPTRNRCLAKLRTALVDTGFNDPGFNETAFRSTEGGEHEQP